MDASPLQKWQDSSNLNDFEVAGKTGLKRDRWLNLKAGSVLPTKEEAEILRTVTKIPDIADQCRRYAQSKVHRAPPVVPPKQP